MALASYKRQQVPVAREKASLSRDFSKLQKTALAPDKSNFSSYAYAQNVIHKGADATSRRGYSELLSDGDIYGTHIYEYQTENSLMAVKEDTTGSKLVKIDRTAGTAADISGLGTLTGQGTPSFTNLNGWMYFCNGSADISGYEADTPTANKETLGLPTGNARLVASDESRLWGVSDDAPEEILYFSQLQAGEITTFDTGASTTIDRGGIANSKIMKYTALIGVGKSVVAFGDNRIEIHRIPDFAANGITSFPADISTLVHSLDNVGITGPEAVIALDNTIYFKPEDGYLYRLNVETGSSKRFADNRRQMEDFFWDAACLGYDQGRKILLISGKTVSGGNNDVVVAFNTEEENFSTFTNIYADQWVNDKDNVYFLNSQGVYDAFQESQVTDAGTGIDIVLRTQAIESVETYLKAVRLFLNTRVWENTSVTLELFADRSSLGDLTADWSKTIDYTLSTNNFGSNPQSFGLGVWGGAGIKFGTPTTEDKRNNEFVNIFGTRFELQLTATVTESFEVRGLGLYTQPTTRRINNLTLDS